MSDVGQCPNSLNLSWITCVEVEGPCTVVSPVLEVHMELTEKCCPIITFYSQPCRETAQRKQKGRRKESENEGVTAWKKITRVQGKVSMSRSDELEEQDVFISSHSSLPHASSPAHASLLCASPRTDEPWRERRGLHEREDWVRRRCNPRQGTFWQGCIALDGGNDLFTCMSV